MKHTQTIHQFSLLTQPEKGKNKSFQLLTIQNIFLIGTFRSLIRFPNQFLDLILQFLFQRCDFLQYYSQLD